MLNQLESQLALFRIKIVNGLIFRFIQQETTIDIPVCTMYLLLQYPTGNCLLPITPYIPRNYHFPIKHQKVISLSCF